MPESSGRVKRKLAPDSESKRDPEKVAEHPPVSLTLKFGQPIQHKFARINPPHRPELWVRGGHVDRRFVVHGQVKQEVGLLLAMKSVLGATVGESVAIRSPLLHAAVGLRH